MIVNSHFDDSIWLWSILIFPPSTVHGYTEMILMNLCRRRFHVNSIFSSPRGSFNFSVSPSPYENNEDMKTQRDIQRIWTQSRYRWTKNSDKQCHVPSSFRERIENSWRFNVSWHDSLIWKQESILWIDMLSPTFARWRDVFPCNHNNDKWITNTIFKLIATKSSNMTNSYWFRRLIRHDREASDKLGIRCHFFVKWFNPKIDSRDRKLRDKLKNTSSNQW